jgi:predicted esterase
MRKVSPLGNETLKQGRAKPQYMERQKLPLLLAALDLYLMPADTRYGSRPGGEMGEKAQAKNTDQAVLEEAARRMVEAVKADMPHISRETVELLLYGFSLGAAVASELAEGRNPLARTH